MVEEQCTLQRNCNKIKARLPKGEDEKEREETEVARFRCGDDVRERQHWRKEKDRRCRICKEEEETVWHVIARYEATGGSLGVEKF